jgi:hypothetical protein
VQDLELWVRKSFEAGEAWRKVRGCEDQMSKGGKKMCRWESICYVLIVPPL